ncbi:MAG TPA: lipid-A-disaccharide synthase [Bacteroidia bacterium]|jgi:lipid-A-disaccharide synthase|nr:lipid-A-disaccharide synthase [Bacteroidia bacterium]
MKYYIIAGEASGDLHASNLMRELHKRDTQAEFRCWGGDLMQEQGGHIVKHYRDLAFMGFTEVLANIRTILQNIAFCKKDIVEWKPDVVILVDYPGFNLRIAEFVKSKGIRVFYYISPAIWAWKQNRVHKIKRSVDRMFTILPFEEEFYNRFQMKVDFVGHPLLDALVHSKENELQLSPGKPLIALLPGSRKQEIAQMLPVMLETAKAFPQYQFIVAGAPSLPASYYETFLKGHEIQIVFGQTYGVLRQAYAALVTSGTATLETALFRVPEVVCYKGGAISYQIARRLVKVKYISLVNLIMDREIVKELIQDEFTVDNLKSELIKITTNSHQREVQLKGLDELKVKLGGPGASARLADYMIRYLQAVHA